MRTRIVGLALALVCVVAGCGGGSKPSGSERALNADEQAYVAKLQKLCIAAKSFAAYADAIAAVKAPGRFEASQKRRVAALRRPGAGFATDDALDAQLGLVDCIAVRPIHALAARGATLRALRPALNAACIDNAARAARARKLAGASAAARWWIDAAAPARLVRLIDGFGQPAEPGPLYSPWRDAQRTVANLRKLGADAWFSGDTKRADAMKAQAARTDAAGRKTARRIGLVACARLPA